MSCRLKLSRRTPTQPTALCGLLLPAKLSRMHYSSYSTTSKLVCRFSLSISLLPRLQHRPAKAEECASCLRFLDCGPESKANDFCSRPLWSHTHHAGDGCLRLVAPRRPGSGILGARAKHHCTRVKQRRRSRNGGCQSRRIERTVRPRDGVELFFARCKRTSKSIMGDSFAVLDRDPGAADLFPKPTSAAKKCTAATGCGATGTTSADFGRRHHRR